MPMVQNEVFLVYRFSGFLFNQRKLKERHVLAKRRGRRTLEFMNILCTIHASGVFKTRVYIIAVNRVLSFGFARFCYFWGRLMFVGDQCWSSPTLVAHCGIAKHDTIRCTSPKKNRLLRQNESVTQWPKIPWPVYARAGKRVLKSLQTNANEHRCVGYGMGETN